MSSILHPAAIHWVVLPVVVPLAAGVLMLLLGDQRRGGQRLIAWIALAIQAACAWAAIDRVASDALTVYPLSDWPAPFGIALVLDRLSAIMLALSIALGAVTLLYAAGGWDRRGRYFHPLFQFQLMGLHGAFLTGDLFNLFVFFEVLLAASYGLLLHGQGARRARAGLHYVVINLVASAFFLIAVSLLYAVTGTLNMADLAQRVATLKSGDSAIAASAGLLLLVVFATKAAVVPLHVWLPGTYTAAAAPVAALFAILSKVGLYAIVRLFTLVCSEETNTLCGPVTPWLIWIAALTVAIAAIGALAAKTVRELAAYLVILSIGTALAPIALGADASLGAALLYMVHSTLAGAALFLLAELIARARGSAGDRIAVGRQPARAGLLGSLFLLAAISIAGLPPLSGFIAKLMILRASFDSAATAWVWVIVLGGGAASILAFIRAGSFIFWNTIDTPFPAVAAPLRAVELIATLLLVSSSVLISVNAQWLHAFTAATARQLSDRALYYQPLLGVKP